MRKLLILLLLVAAPLSAQWHRAKLFGADVRALIVDPSDPDTLYLGTSGGEVYVSHDAAKTWSNPRNSVEFPGYVVDNLVIDRDGRLWAACWGLDRKSTRLNSSHSQISYAVFCLKKKKIVHQDRELDLGGRGLHACPSFMHGPLRVRTTVSIFATVIIPRVSVPYICGNVDATLLL